MTVGDSILNLLLYGKPESSRAASIGATANAPCREGAAKSSTGEGLLLIESEADERRSRTPDSGSDPRSVCTTLLQTRSTNLLRLITPPSNGVGPACRPNPEGAGRYRCST